MTDSPGEIARALKAFIEARAPERGAVRVSGLCPAPGGSSTENWFFDADWSTDRSRGPEPLMLRRAPRSEVVLVDRGAEFAILEHLNDRPIPSPRAWWQGELGGRFAMVLERCAGRASRMVLTERNHMALEAPARLALARQMTDILADLHQQELPDAPEGNPAETALAPYIARVAAMEDEVAAELRLGLWWLRENIPASSGRAVVHGDYRPANILIHDGQVSAVLDWEFAHPGDPAEDIGWYLADVYRRQHFIPGQFEPADFLARYEARRGVTLDRAALAWWAVFALQKLATIAVETLQAFLAGDDGRILQSPDRHLAALMRAVERDGKLQGVT